MTSSPKLCTLSLKQGIVKSLPSSLYTSNECLKIIKERDKDSEAEYVKEFMSDVAKELSK